MLCPVVFVPGWDVDEGWAMWLWVLSKSRFCSFVLSWLVFYCFVLSVLYDEEGLSGWNGPSGLVDSVDVKIKLGSDICADECLWLLERLSMALEGDVPWCPRWELEQEERVELQLSCFYWLKGIA